MGEKIMTKEEKEDFDKWVSEREHEIFEVDKFKKIGKENDYFFQVLSFMGHASQKMSLAFTLTDLIEDFPKELKEELREIACKYHELQDKVRDLNEKQKQ